VRKLGILGAVIALAIWLLRRGSEGSPAPPPAAEDAIEGYCMKERKKVAIANPEPTTSKDGRSAVRGTCADCGSKIFRFT
jgi:hypothetical protein